MIFCRNFNKGNECWHVTLMTIRPLNILYFDGSSAAKVASGTMDTQDLIVWNEIRFGWMSEEWQRIADLCAWGEKYGLDGFVRMEMDFEIMLCSFTSGVKVVSFSNLADATPVRLDTWRMFEAMNAGSWHNHYPGETRIQLDLTRLVSFYDTTLAPSLVPLRFAKERWDHRLLNISKEDIARVNARLDEVLTTPSDYPTSGIDWLALIRVIVDRYAQRLELTQHLLNSTESADPTSLLQYANKTQLQLRIMLTPYILSGVMPSSPDTKGNGVDVLDWAVPVFKLCATAHTDMLLDDHPMTNSEELLFTAIQETTRQICRITTRMWAAGVLAGLDEFLNPSALEPEAEEIRDLTKTWRRDLDWLMQWLDWNVWVKCRPACGPEEMCYLTTWPIGFPKPERRRPPSHGMLDSSQRPSKATPSMLHPRDSLLLTLQKGNPQDDWERPQPRCIQVVEPYLGL
ncbi:hypothetical protein ID866_9714 [Astraeus odoratus]|nr:hypothetical protein ID866_9714 [Astraeus odoratus]